MQRRPFLTALTSLATLAGHAPWSRAQGSYPTRPITLLVGGAPGSVPDMMSRPLAERLAAALGTAVVVENKPGAAGALAMAALVRSAPDGHTVALGTMSQLVFNTHLFSKLSYDPLHDLAPITPLVSGAMALAAHAADAPRSLAQFVERAKAQRGKLFVAIPQAGSPPHIVGLLLARATGIEVTMVPHTSGADAVKAVLSGEIAYLLDAPTILATHVAAGRFVALAVTGREREPTLRDTPTVGESGYDMQGEAWIGLVAPAGTPPDIVARLSREAGLALAAPELRETMRRLGFRTLTSTPQAFAALIKAEHAKWGALIRDAGLKLE